MRLFLAAALCLGVLSSMASAEPNDSAQPKKHDHEHECALKYEMKTIDGETVDLGQYEGKVVLIVNTASECGYTPQYAGLEELYQKYKDKGLVVLGFPCNQFGGQEPGTDSQIKKFCSTRFNVSFPMFSKIDVNGPDAAPLYQFLTSQDVKPAGKGKVGWNFEKYLVDREGKVVGRFKSGVTPMGDQLTDAIEAQL